MSKNYIVVDPLTGLVKSRFPSDIEYPSIPSDAIEVDEAVLRKSMEHPADWVYDFASGGLKIRPEPPYQERLDLAKYLKVKELSRRYVASNGQPISFLGTTFDADEAAKTNLKDVLTAFSATTLPSDFFWVDANNAQIPVTYSDLEGLAKALADRGWVFFQKLQRLKSRTKDAVTLEEVEAIIW